MKNAVVDCAGKVLNLTEPQVMGVINVTPDSFSDGGKYRSLDAALERGLQMQRQGAGIIDVGGESTRPGAQEISIDEELDRVIPVIERLAKNLTIPVSIDTQKPQVMHEAVVAGAGMINDVYALQQTGAVDVVLEHNVPVCIMHMLGKPRTMQQQPTYQDVVTDVYTFLQQRIEYLKQRGVREDNILIDPGFGFGKTVEHNLMLLQQLNKFCRFDRPIVVGLSRKSMLGKLLQRDVNQRLAGSIALAVLAVNNGAQIIRAHDVQETVDAVRLCQWVKSGIEIACDN